MAIAGWRRGDWGARLWERVADSGHGGGNFAGNLLIHANQLRGALTDFAGEGLCCGVPSGPLRG
ncbi:hypothetical protein A5697_16275 [Mycobacterium sp. E3251]|nr:hypothetical protein A5697_16275 [Mycobacterium sp. E3251]OBI25359.1 hypothetical protein A5711_06435 [Mycobacterium sp. E2238]OBI30487.1 hypothetical protein A5709_25440 [Mycobacterium sp. E1386]